MRSRRIISLEEEREGAEKKKIKGRSKLVSSGGDYLKKITYKNGVGMKEGVGEGTESDLAKF